MYRLPTLFCLLALTACGDKDADSGDEPAPVTIEPFEFACGSATCDGSLEACWFDCGAEDPEGGVDGYSCQPLPESCYLEGATSACAEDSGADCNGTVESGLECAYICG